MDVGDELQNKDAFGEIILEGNFVQIAIWIDGDWAVADSALYKTKSMGEKPIFIFYETDLLNMDANENFLKTLIKQIDEKIKVRIEQQSSNF